MQNIVVNHLLFTKQEVEWKWTFALIFAGEGVLTSNQKGKQHFVSGISLCQLLFNLILPSSGYMWVRVQENMGVA